MRRARSQNSFLNFIFFIIFCRMMIISLLRNASEMSDRILVLLLLTGKTISENQLLLRRRRRRRRKVFPAALTPMHASYCYSLLLFLLQFEVCLGCGKRPAAAPADSWTVLEEQQQKQQKMRQVQIFFIRPDYRVQQQI